MRVISNTFSLTAVPDVQAVRPNLVHCSLFQQDRLGWWILPSSSNAELSNIEPGMYGIDGFDAYRIQPKPGAFADIKQSIAVDFKNSSDDYNAATGNYGLDAGKWYTLSFKCRGVLKKHNADGTYSPNGSGELVVYLVGYNGGGVTIVDTSEKYIVDGVEKSPSGDMMTKFTIGWNVCSHTITFKTRSDLKTIARPAVPVLYFRSFGEGYSGEYNNGSTLFKVACIKIEEGMEATAYTPHATEMQPPVHAVAFKRDNTDISGTTPTGGTYTSPTPTGWSDGIPTGEARLWETKAVFVPELPSATWSKPSPVGDTSDSDVEFSPYDGTPVSDVSNNLAAAGTVASPTTNKWFDPVRNAGADFSKMIWRAERQKKNGTWGSWAIVKVKGEKGENGKDGQAGKDAVTLDLDNEIDAIPCNYNGYLGTAKTYNLNIGAYLGTTSLTLTGCVAEVSPLHPCITVDTGVGDDTETTLGSPIVKVSPSTFTGTYTITFICKTDQGTRSVVFTLATQRAGSPGESPTIYQLAPSHTALSYVRDGAGNLTGSNVLTCKMKQTTGSSTSETDVSSSSTYYIYYGYNDAASPSTRLQSSGLTVSASTAASRKNVVLELWNGSRDLTTSVRLDRETIPILKDGSKGEDGNPGTPGSPGADATIAWLDCPYVAIQCDKDGYSRVDKFTVKSLKRTGDSAPASANAPAYSIDYYVYYDGGTYDSANNSLSGGNTLEVSIDTSKKLSYVEIYLNIKGTVTTVAQTIRLNPVLDGPMGSAGYDYLPQVLGIYSDSEPYTWDETVRQGCFYEISGTYNIYYVKNRMTTNRGIAPTGSDTDPYWSKADRVYTIFTDALYATNASVGGFLLSDKMLLSAQASYLMTYRGSASAIAYRGAWQSANTYSSGNIVYSDGYFYRYTSSSSTTSKPSVDSRWTKLSESYYTDKYIIDMCTAYGTSSSVTVSLYGYYDSSSKDRPFVYYSSKFWTLKKYGYATALPSETSTQWRELFDAEKLMLGITDTSNSASFSYGSTTIYRRSISKYLLNGKEGTTMMLQPDDTIWTYDMTGKQTLGIPYGKHIEIDPADGKMRFYNTNGTQNGEVSGETVSNIDDLLGSPATGFSGESKYVSYTGNGVIGRRETKETQIGGNITLSGNGALNISSTLKLQGSQWNTDNPAGGGASSGSVGPLPGGTPVPGLSGKLYTNTVSAFLIVQKQSGSTWVNVATASSQNSTSATSLSVTSTSSRTVNLSEGTYRIVLRCEISVYANNLYGVSVNATSVSASVSSFVDLHRFFGNGFAFGSSSNNFFAAINESAGIHVKASTSSNYGFELSQTKGLEVKRGGQQGIVPVLLWYGFVTDSGSSLSVSKKYSCDGNNPTFTRPGNGLYKLTLHSNWQSSASFSGGNVIATITAYGTSNANVTGTSARIKEMGENYILIETANDREVDNSSLIIKLEYIG